MSLKAVVRADACGHPSGRLTSGREALGPSCILRLVPCLEEASALRLIVFQDFPFPDRLTYLWATIVSSPGNSTVLGPIDGASGQVQPGLGDHFT